jgi:WD40 repeat protein
MVTGVFSSDLSKILCGYRQTAVLWDVATGKQLQTFPGHQGYVFAAAISPDGSKIATGSDDKCWRIWDANTGALLKTIPESFSYATAAAFLKDGTTLATISHDGIMTHYEIATGSMLKSIDIGGGECAAFSSDGNQVAVGTWNRGLQLMDLQKCSLVKNYQGHIHPLNAVAFSPDNSQLLTSAMDSMAILWNVK